MTALVKRAVFTVCSVNYINKAVALGKSIIDFNDDVDFIIVLVDTKRRLTVRLGGIQVKWIEDLNYNEFRKAAFKYDVIEFNTAVKPHCASCLLDKYEKVIYLDPDTFVYDSLDCIYDRLDSSAVLLTPHTLTPYTDNKRPNNLDISRFGVFNLGFFAANRHAKAFLLWWDRMLRDYCFYEPALGMGVDQKWVDQAPALFDSVEIIKNPGLNVAFWNLHERTLNIENGKFFVNGSFPLIFMHYSSFPDKEIDRIAIKQTRFKSGDRPDFVEVAGAYRNALVSSSQYIDVDDTTYGFDRFSDGRYLTHALRRYYSLSEFCLNGSDDPFSDKALSELARKNRLSTRSRTVFNYTGDSQLRYKRGATLIAYFFKLALFILGPSRYYMLCRHLSKYTSLVSQTAIARALLNRR